MLCVKSIILCFYCIKALKYEVHCINKRKCCIVYLRGKKMKEQLKKLIDVKSIVTLSLTLVYCILSVRGNLSQEFINIYLMIISFYFGTQVQKKSESINKDE